MGFQPGQLFSTESTHTQAPPGRWFSGKTIREPVVEWIRRWSLVPESAGSSPGRAALNRCPWKLSLNLSRSFVTQPQETNKYFHHPTSRFGKSTCPTYWCCHLEEDCLTWSTFFCRKSSHFCGVVVEVRATVVKVAGSSPQDESPWIGTWSLLLYNGENNWV